MHEEEKVKEVHEVLETTIEDLNGILADKEASPAAKRNARTSLEWLRQATMISAMDDIGNRDKCTTTLVWLTSLETVEEAGQNEDIQLVEEVNQIERTAQRLNRKISKELNRLNKKINGSITGMDVEVFYFEKDCDVSVVITTTDA